MLDLWMLAVAVSFTLATADSPSGSPKACFDWAVVARVNNQTYLGSPALPDGEITLDSVFRWDIEVRRVILGGKVPKHLQLSTTRHAELVPWSAARQVLFLRKEDDGSVRTLSTRTLDRDLEPSRWRREVNTIAQDEHLIPCAGINGEG